MSIRTKIDFSGITSDHIVTSDNKKYIHEDDEIFNSLKDEIAACENAQVQTEIATLQILEIKEQTKVIANDAIDTVTERAESAAQFAETSAQNAENAAQNAEEIREEIIVIANEVIDTATERAETAAENAENAQTLAETAAINALEAERNITEFSETLAKLDGDNTFTGNNNFTGTLTINDEEVLTSSDFDDFVKLDEDNTFTGNNNFTGSLTINNNDVLTTNDITSFVKTNTNNTFSGTNNFTGTLLVGGKAVLTSEDTNNFAKLNVDNNFTGALTVNNKSVLTSSDSTVFAKTNANNTFSGTNNFTGTLQSKGNTVLTTSDASNYFKLNTTNTIDGDVLIKDTRTFSNFGYDWESKSGAILALCSKDYTNAGFFKLFAQDGTNRVSLTGNPNGELKWGNITIDSNHIVLSDAITYFSLGFNESNDNNPRIAFFSKDNTSENNRGSFAVTANDGTNKYQLVGRPSNGGLFWGGQRIVTQYNPHSLYFDHTNGTSKDIGYSTGNNNTKRGAYMTFWNGDDASNAGTFRLAARDETNHINLIGTTSGSLTWNNSAIPTVGSNNTFTGTNNFTGTLQSKGNTVLTTSDANNYFKLDATNVITKDIVIKDTSTFVSFGYDYNTKKGAALALHSINHSTESKRGSFALFARDATNSYALEGRAYDGALVWKGKRVITQDTPYNLFFDQTSGTYKYLGYNTDSNKTVSGSYIKFHNTNDTSTPGHLTITARDLKKQASLSLTPDGTLTWSGGNLSVGGQSVIRRVTSSQATGTWHTHITSGLLIQSGEYLFTKGNSTGDVITLSKPFNTAYYTVLVILDGDTTNEGNGMLSVVEKTTTSFKIHNGQDKTGMYRWIAIGFSLDFS